MSDDALDAFGMKLQFGNGATPEVFTDVGNLTDVGDLTLSRENKEVTAHTATGKFKQKHPGLREAGDITFKVNFDPSLGTHDEVTGFMAQFNDDDIHNYRILYPQSTTEGWAFAGFITKIAIKSPLDGTLEGEITITPTGKPVYGAF
jgi:hypothetical protein